MHFAGDYASLEMSSIMLLIPIYTLTIHRRCIAMEDGVTIVVALLGIILVTRPTFIFGNSIGMEEVASTTTTLA